MKVNLSVCLSVCSRSGRKLSINRSQFTGWSKIEIHPRERSWSMARDVTCSLADWGGGGGPVWQHNSIVSGWSGCLNEFQLHHCKEPRNLYIENDNCPDNVIFDPTNGTNTELDISMAHPWSKRTLKRSAEEAGYATELQEIKKKANYNQELSQRGSSPSMILLVFKHFRFWGNEADSYLNHLSKKSKDAEGLSSEEDFRNRWRKQFSINYAKA